MTTLIPRQFYSQEELDKLYPKELELQLVQIVSTNVIASFRATTN
jgi:acid phosphatase